MKFGGNMEESSVKISVGMPVYNGEPFLEKAIESILSQTFSDFELIISDNASTDRTEEICRKFESVDSRITYIRNDINIGAARNYQQVFQKSTAKYFRWFNADDLCEKTLHERCFSTMEENPDASMVYGKTILIDDEGEIIEHYDDNLHLTQESAADRFLTYLSGPGLTNAIYGLIRRSALENSELMGRGTFPAADIVLVAELALRGKIIEIPSPLFFRRMHDQASSWDKGHDAQQQFWSGAAAQKFVMPTLKFEFALLRAILRSQITFYNKLQLIKAIFCRISWWKGQIFKEFKGYIRS